MAVTFQDGEPVDPIKLNDLQTQITEIRSITNRLQTQINSGDGTQTTRIPIVTGGTFSVDVTAGTIYTQDINFGTVYAENEIPDVVACVRSGISKTVDVSVQVINVSKSPQIQIKATGYTGSKKIYVSWIAHYARIVTA
jgi:hypothetical protein